MAINLAINPWACNQFPPLRSKSPRIVRNFSMRSFCPISSNYIFQEYSPKLVHQV